MTLLSVTTQAHNQHIGELRGQIDQRFEATNQQIAEVRQEVAEVRQGMNGRFEQVATHQQLTEVRQEVAGTRPDVNSRFEALEQGVNSRFDQVIALLSQRGQ